ncbi:MAG: anthranilate synthase/aminodeoxychorismate synthase-like glutamine amidotransferase [Myxococcota bacterium]|jgi:anthranilate synthase/aminodeoxychorismate synthase-like glutamine amidotransferase
MVLLIDNYDSFTYNLAQALMVLGAEVTVYRNDAITLAQIAELAPGHLVISPGPGRPEDAGISPDAIAMLTGRIPVLGVCLGHQAIVSVLGGVIGAARSLMHGEPSQVRHDGRGLFAGLPADLTVGRYHSLAADPAHLPAALEVSATTADGEIMAVRHRTHPTLGVQFHPESVLTPQGPALLANFLKMKADQ